MAIRKQIVEQFTIDGLGKSAVGDGTIVLSRDEMFYLYSEVAEALGVPALHSEHCGDRFSHKPHSEIKRGIIVYCNGRAYDAT